MASQVLIVPMVLCFAILLYRDTNLLVWGVDLVEEHLMTAAGIPARPPVAKKPLVNMAEYSINAHSTGYIRNFDFLTPWQQHPDVLYARPLVKVGSRVWVGWLGCRGSRAGVGVLGWVG